MISTICITGKEDFHMWQEKVQKFFKDAKKQETLCINEEYKDVLQDYKASKAEHKRIIDEFTALLDRQPKSSYSWESDSEIMKAHAATMEEMGRVNIRFQIKWGNRYEEYLSVMDALKKEYKKVMALTRSPVAYKNALANLAKRDMGEGGEPDA